MKESVIIILVSFLSVSSFGQVDQNMTLETSKKTNKLDSFNNVHLSNKDSLNSYCESFNSTDVDTTFTSTSFGPVFYSNAFMTMQGRFVDQAVSIGGSVGLQNTIPAWQSSNPNFSGTLFVTAEASILYDFSNFSSASKTVSFDATYIPSTSLNLFKIDGVYYTNPPSGVAVNITNLSSGHHIEVSGNFTTIEFGGFENAIDNLCIEGVANLNDEINVNRENLNIYPNPSSDRVNISFKGLQSNKITIDVLDANGKVVAEVYQGEHKKEQIYQWQNNVQRGTYLIRLNTGTKVMTKPIVIN